MVTGADVGRRAGARGLATDSTITTSLTRGTVVVLALGGGAWDGAAASSAVRLRLGVVHALTLNLGMVEGRMNRTRNVHTSDAELKMAAAKGGCASNKRYSIEVAAFALSVCFVMPSPARAVQTKHAKGPHAQLLFPTRCFLTLLRLLSYILPFPKALHTSEPPDAVQHKPRSPVRLRRDPPLLLLPSDTRPQPSLVAPAGLPNRRRTRPPNCGQKRR